VIDSHAHLDACDGHPQEVVRRAAAAGVTGIVSVGAGIESSRRTAAIAGEVPGVYASLGIDPHSAGDEHARLDELQALLTGSTAVAVGETGLDYHYGQDTVEQQRAAFAGQLELAGELRLPVVIHCRAAAAEVAATLARFDGTVVLHCFSEPDLLRPALERGYYVSFAGNVTYRSAGDLRAAAAAIPADRLLVETDSPFLAPQARRGRRNEPANLVHTVAVLAEARGEETEELGARTAANACAAFGLP
jgi:TatD DNase family protein